MNTDPLPRELIEMRVGLEATYHVVFLEIIGALVEQGCLDPEKLRTRLEAASDDISKVPLATGQPPRMAESGVRLLQQLADGVAKRHGLEPRHMS